MYEILEREKILSREKILMMIVLPRVVSHIPKSIMENPFEQNNRRGCKIFSLYGCFTSPQALPCNFCILLVVCVNQMALR